MTTANKKLDTPVEIVAVIDKSGSMASLHKEAVEGFNKFLADQQALPGEANLTLIMFSDEATVLIHKKPIADVKPLTMQDYIPSGFTALYDGIGLAFLNLDLSDPEKAILCILTDGQENASQKFKNEDIKDKITAAEKRGWRVIYLAANQDAFTVGMGMGVKRGATMNFAATSAGLADAYSSATIATSNYRSGNVVDLNQAGSNTP